MKNEKVLNTVLISGISLLIIAAIIASIRGEFEVTTVVLAAIGAAAAGVYAAFNFAKIKELFTNKSARYGFNALIYTLLVTAILVLAQTILTIHSKSWDVTMSRHHTISEQTKKVLGALKTKVEAYYFYSARARVTQIEDTLELYMKESPKFKFQAIDADRSPSTAMRFKVDKYGVVVLFRPDNNSQEKIDTLTEGGITNALIRITREAKKKIYFTKGHGEPPLDAPKNEKSGVSMLKEELQAYNYEASDVELFSSPFVPSDCTVLVIDGPQADLFDQEVVSINKYLRQGGKVLILDAPLVNVPRLNAMLKARGVVAHNDIVIDKMGRMFGGDPLMPIISMYDQHEITSSLKAASFMPNTRTFDLQGKIAGVTIASLARTTPGSWGETDLNSVMKGEVNQDPKDLTSPLVVAAVISIDNAAYKTAADPLTSTSKAIIAVFGSADFINNTFLGASANKDLILNTLNYLSGEGDTIAIKPKDNSFEPLFLSKIAGRMLFLIPVVFLPLLVVAIGVMVFIRRRMS